MFFSSQVRQSSQNSKKNQAKLMKIFFNRSSTIAIQDLLRHTSNQEKRYQSDRNLVIHTLLHSSLLLKQKKNGSYSVIESCNWLGKLFSKMFVSITSKSFCIQKHKTVIWIKLFTNWHNHRFATLHHLVQSHILWDQSANSCLNNLKFSIEQIKHNNLPFRSKLYNKFLYRVLLSCFDYRGPYYTRYI
jgi:hypothetical protein